MPHNMLSWFCLRLLNALLLMPFKMKQIEFSGRVDNLFSVFNFLCLRGFSLKLAVVNILFVDV